jgi:hypothetical protein
MSNSWYMASVAQGGVYKRVGELFAEGAAVVGEGTEVAARITDMAEFFLFLQEEVAALVERWQRRKVSPAGPNGATPAGPDRR